MFDMRRMMLTRTKYLHRHRTTGAGLQKWQEVRRSRWADCSPQTRINAGVGLMLLLDVLEGEVECC